MTLTTLNPACIIRKWRSHKPKDEDTFYTFSFLFVGLLFLFFVFFQTGQLMWGKKKITSKSSPFQIESAYEEKCTFQEKLFMLCGRLDWRHHFIVWSLNTRDLVNLDGLTNMLALKEKKRKDSSCVFSVLEIVASVFFLQQLATAREVLCFIISPLVL